MNDFIENIFAYCDRWCERCAFTAKCKGFVNNNNLPVSDLLKSDEQNRIFWKKTGEILPKAISFIENTAKHNNIDLTVFENIPKQVKFDLFQRKAVSNNVLKAGRQYEDMVDDRIDKEIDNGRIIAVETQLGGAYKINPSVIQAPEQEFINDMISIIMRYQLQLYLKISRAYYSKGISSEVLSIENASDEKDKISDDAATDANGTVKALLEMINRSISAWYAYAIKTGTDDDKEIFEIMLLLTRIKNNLISDFPEAMKFIRPGFDM